jgi:hypothetical protein
MRENVYKIGSISMALLVLFSTLSISMDMHFCGDTLVDFKLFQKADSCGVEMESSMEMIDDNMEMQCCTDVEMVVPGQDELQIFLDTFSPEQETFLISFAYTYLQIYQEGQEQCIPFKEYAPPLLIRDIQVLDQTFII